MWIQIPAAIQRAGNARQILAGQVGKGRDMTAKSHSLPEEERRESCALDSGEQRGGLERPDEEALGAEPATSVSDHAVKSRNSIKGIYRG